MPKSKPSRTVVTVQLPTEAAERLLKQWKAQDPRMLRWLAYYGLKVEDIVIPTAETSCPYCNGTGHADGLVAVDISDYVPCPQCGGSGVVFESGGG